MNDFMKKDSDEIMEMLKSKAEELRAQETPEAQLATYAHEQYNALLSKTTELGLGGDVTFNCLVTHIITFAVTNAKPGHRDEVLRIAIKKLQMCIDRGDVLNKIVLRSRGHVAKEETPN